MSPASSLLSQAPAAMQGRAFSGSASGPGEAAAAVDMAKPGGDFPWRGAPNLIPEPAGSGSFLDGMMESIFEEFCLKGVDFTAGAEAAFVTTAAAFFKMRTLKVRAPKPSVETAAAGVDGASKGDAEEDLASAGAEQEEEDKEKSAETSEEEADRVLAAVDKGLVALSSDKGGVPYYRLHRVVAKAIRRKKFIFGVQRGDDLSGRFTVTISPSLEFVLQENNAFAQIRNALAGNATVTFQVLVGGFARDGTPTPPEKRFVCRYPKVGRHVPLLLTVEILCRHSRERVEESAPRLAPAFHHACGNRPEWVGVPHHTKPCSLVYLYACSVLSTRCPFSPTSFVLP
ncbi:unnamed protein product [Ectocarpus sp. 8 AP-2014]